MMEGLPHQLASFKHAVLMLVAKVSSFARVLIMTN